MALSHVYYTEPQKVQVTYFIPDNKGETDNNNGGVVNTTQGSTASGTNIPSTQKFRNTKRE